MKDLASDLELATYVEEEIRSALPEDWQLQREPDGALRWRILPPSVLTGADEDYRIRMSGDRREIIIEYGNTDAGPLSLRDFLLSAMIFDLDGRKYFPLSKVITEVITNYELNKWGLT
jgi:hypothetical protein